jgi:hypothetical protein
MALLYAIIKAIQAALAVFKQERAIHNTPDMVVAQVEENKRRALDAIYRADKVLADPNATPEQHAEALRQLRLAVS